MLLEAGGHLTNEDYVNNEWEAFNQMAWLDPRTTTGSWRIARDFPNLPAWIVKAVGGTTTHWSGPRRGSTRTSSPIRKHYGRIEGANLLDWPITLDHLAPYYTQAENNIGSTHRGGRKALPANNNYKVLANGAERIGYHFYATGPYGTNAEPYDGRPASIQDGFNFQGDKNKSKWSTLVREIPLAEATGNLDLRPNSHAVQITHDASGRADAVLYLDARGQPAAATRPSGVRRRQRDRDPTVVVAVRQRAVPGRAGELLRSGRPELHAAHHRVGLRAVPDKQVHMYRGETMAGLIADESRHDPSRGFAGGYYLETLSLGVPFLAAFADPGAWGPAFTSILDGYANTAGLWVVGEDMPQETNRVTLNASVTDKHGLPVPNVHFDDHPNDVAMRNHGYRQAELLYEAVGATSAHRTPPYPSTHNLGTARMSARPEDGVVNEFGRAHDVPNLFVSDGSVFTTGAAANPTLTIVALALRQAEHIVDALRAQTL